MGEKKMTAKVARRCGAAVLAATFGVLAGCQSPDSTTSQPPADGQTVTQQTVGERAQQFPDVLNVYADPGQVLYGTYSTNKYNNFADLGAWHGYYLHEQDATHLYGGFAGPVIIAEEYPVNLSGAISRLQLTDKEGNVYDLTKAKAEGTYYPGRLVQTYELDELKVTMELVYGSNRTAVVSTTIENKTDGALELNLAWTGDIYQQTGDKAFLEEMYPKLVSYHNWWYTNRDTDQNGIAEYGAMVDDAHYQMDDDGNFITDENGNRILNPEAVIEAAAWESGMDNAPRFDQEGSGEGDIGVLVFENKDASGQVVGYSINQESVDLNAYLYAEKGFLKSMAEELGKTEDVERYETEAAYVRDYINTKMYDEETGYYYDLQTNQDGSEKKLLVNRGKGPEGWIPLWAKAATQAQADRVVENMMDEGKFNTFVPLGTVSKDNPSFQPAKYWRGPVWLDQAMYGVEAMQNYGYKEEAQAMAYKIFDNCEGLLEDGAIRENYNPETGEGLHTANFSWSASSFYSLYRNTLTGDHTTSQTGFDIPQA